MTDTDSYIVLQIVQDQVGLETLKLSLEHMALVKPQPQLQDNL
jgi:hypothetical protein